MSCMPVRLSRPHVPQAKVRAYAQYLRLRIRAAGEAHRLPRIRRALAARQRDQPDGRAGARPRARHADPGTRRAARDRHRPRLPRLFLLGEEFAGVGPARRRLQGARHRPCDDADGLFRAVRPRRAVRRDGHRLAQRQRLDRREDGRQPPAHLRPRRDDAAEGDRARRALRRARRRRRSCSTRISRSATSPT